MKMITLLRWIAYVVLAIVAGLALEASRLPFWQFMLGCVALLAGVKVCPLSAPRRKRNLSAELRFQYEGAKPTRPRLLDLIAFTGSIYWSNLRMRMKLAALQRLISDMPRVESERRKAEAFERALIANCRRPAWKS